MNKIIIDSVSKSFGNQIVFSNFSCDIPKNKVTAIIGPSGSGKTTLLRMLGNLDKDYSGSIMANNNSISFVFQENRLLPWINAYDNIKFSIEDKPYYSDAHKDIDTLIDLIGLADHINKMPSELSGGMQRRIALARAFVFRSETFLLDEPFKGLDANMKRSVASKLLAFAKKREMTTIFVTHDKDISNLADNIINLS